MLFIFFPTFASDYQSKITNTKQQIIERQDGRNGNVR